MSPSQAQIEAEIAALAAGIEPASAPAAAALRACAAAESAPAGSARTGAAAGMAELAARLAGAQHALPPAPGRRCIVVCAADHGAGAEGALRLEQGLDPGAPTRSALRLLAAGRSPLSAAVHAAGASLVVVDCGMRGRSEDEDRGVLDLRADVCLELAGDVHGERAGSADIRLGPAMSRAHAALSVRAGVALLLSLAESELDVVGLGQVGAGARVASSAVIAALAGATPEDLGHTDRDAVAAALAASPVDPGDPLAVLAGLGGFDIGVLAGVALAAASLRIPVVLDDHATSAAALLAARWQPAVAGYLLAAHPGTAPAHRRALRALGLAPILGQALSHGEGTAAAMVLPFLDRAAEWAGQAIARVGALFVYGSLRSAHPAHALVAPYVAATAPATTAGRLLVLADGYPGLVDDPDARVTGEVLELGDPDAAWAVLDEYEGDAYRRMLRPVTLADGSERHAWCYVPTPAAVARGGEPVPDGDWLAWTRARAT